jgi:hypothetical protein
VTTRIDLISGVGWTLFHELHEQYVGVPGDEFVKLFEQTYHCRIGYSYIKPVEGTAPMKHFYMEFTPEQFTLFQLKYGDHPQRLVFMPQEWFSDN